MLVLLGHAVFDGGSPLSLAPASADAAAVDEVADDESEGAGGMELSACDAPCSESLAAIAEADLLFDRLGVAYLLLKLLRLGLELLHDSSLCSSRRTSVRI